MEQDETDKPQVPQSAGKFVTDLTPNDVLLGRGAPSIENEGNVRFRQIVQARKTEYVGTGKRQMKDLIARQVIKAVEDNNGKFLRKIESLVEAEKMGVPEGTTAWARVDEATILAKVKQALRDKDTSEISSVQPVAAAAAAPTPVESSPAALDAQRRALLQSLGPMGQHQQNQQQAANQAAMQMVAANVPGPEQNFAGFLRTGSPFPTAVRQAERDVQRRASVPPLLSTLNQGMSLHGMVRTPELEDLLAGRGATNQSLANIDQNLATGHTGHTKIGLGYSLQQDAIQAPGNDESPAMGVLEEALVRKKAATESDSVSISLSEWHILQTTVSTGIPVWQPTRLDDMFVATEQGNRLTWSLIGMTLVRNAHQHQQQNQQFSSESARKRIGLSTSLSYVHARELAELARKTICLLEKLHRLYSLTEKRGPSNATYDWLAQQLCWWAASLEVVGTNGRPLAHSAYDVRSSLPEYSNHDAFAPAADLSSRDAQCILKQIATLTRLRSIVKTTHPTDLLKEIDEIEHLIEGHWRTKPPWWATLDHNQMLQLDVALLEGTLNKGYHGILQELAGKVLPGLTRASIADRVGLLVDQLHVKQLQREEKKGVEDRTLWHLTSLRGALSGSGSSAATGGGGGGYSLDASMRQLGSSLDDRSEASGSMRSSSKRFRDDRFPG